MQRKTFLVSNALILSALCYPGANLRAETIVIGEDAPSVYRPVANPKDIQRLNDQYPTAIDFSQYEAGMGQLVHPVTILNGNSKSSANPAPQAPAADASTNPTKPSVHQFQVQADASSPTVSNVLTINDPDGLLNTAEESSLITSLESIPLGQWHGVQTILIEPSSNTLNTGAALYDVTSNSLILKIPSPPLHQTEGDDYILFEAVADYFYQYNLPAQAKAEFSGSDVATVDDFAQDEAFYLLTSGAKYAPNPRTDALSGNGPAIVNDLFWASLFAVPGLPKVYTYTLTSQGLVRTLQSAYISGNTIVYDGMTIYFNSQDRITGVKVPGSRAIVSIDPNITPNTVPAVVFQYLQQVSPPPPTPPVRRPIHRQ